MSFAGDRRATTGIPGYYDMLSDQPMRFLMISTAPGFHGGEQQAELLWRGLEQRGHRVLGVVPRDSVWAGHLAERRAAWFSIARRGWAWTSMLRLNQAWNDFRPDAVLLNDPHALTLWQIQQLCQRSRTWWTGSSASPLPAVFAARRVDFPLRRPQRYRRICNGLLCVSQAIAQQCYHDGVPAEQLFVVPDGCDPARLAQADAARGRAVAGVAADAGPLILCVARLADHKGHRYLLPAFAHLTQHHPRAELILAGDGELDAELRQLAAQLGIASQVRFLGFTRHVPDLLAAADVAVIASHMEGLCSSIIDAMLARCPVVATRAGGIPDLLDRRVEDPQQVGWLVPIRDSLALAEALNAALQDETLRKRYVETAQQRALQLFTHTAMVEQTLRVCCAVRSGHTADVHFRPNQASADPQAGLAG